MPANANESIVRWLGTGGTGTGGTGTDGDAALQGSRVIRTWWPSDIMIGKESAYSSMTEAARYAVSTNSDTYPTWTEALPTLGARSLQVSIAVACASTVSPFAVDLYTGVRPFGGSAVYWPPGGSPEVAQLVRIVPIAAGVRSYDPGAITIFETDPTTGDEKQQLLQKGSPTGGTFTLALDGTATDAIAYDATAGVIQAALEAKLGTGNVLVTGGPINSQAVVVQFAGSLGDAGRSLMVANSAGLTGGSTPTVAVGRLPRKEVLGDWWRLRIRVPATTIVTISASARS